MMKKPDNRAIIALISTFVITFLFLCFISYSNGYNTSTEDKKKYNVQELIQEMDKIDYVAEEINIYIKDFDWETWYYSENRNDQSKIIASIIEKYGYREDNYYVRVIPFAEGKTGNVVGVYIAVLIKAHISKIDAVYEWYYEFQERNKDVSPKIFK